jgi:CotS family spore coat protein
MKIKGGRDMLKELDKVTRITGEETLSSLLKHYYGIVLIDAKPVRGVLRIKTDQGYFALKRVRNNEKERWRFLNEFKLHVSQNSLIQKALPLTTFTGKPYFNGYHFSYVVIPWIKAKPIEWQIKEDWEKATEAIANFHQLSKDFMPTKPRSDLHYTGRWLSKWEKGIQQCEIFHLAAKWTSIPTEVDQFWLETASYTTSIMENLLEYYQKIGGDKLCLQTEKYGKICHGNLHRNNLLRNDKGQIYLIDWNEAILNVRAYDLANWLLYAYGRTGKREVLKAIIDSYQKVSPIEEMEFSLIYACLLYPEKLVRSLGAIYEEETLEITSAISLINQLTAIEEKKISFFKQYISLLKEDYKISIPHLDWIHKR